MAFEEEMIVELVIAVRRFQPKIGGKKLYSLLKDEMDQISGGAVGRDKFFDILRRNGLLVKRRKKYPYTTQSYHRFKVYKNELKNKVLTGPNQAYVSDITYLRTTKGFVYLSLITDAWSRMIVGWALSDSLSIEGTLKTLKTALRSCKTSKGLIHHSDRGIQYCSYAYINLLKKYGVIISMTEENHCYENSLAERVNGILKDEFLLDETFSNKEIARKAVIQAIDSYNTKRPHWSLDLKIPWQVHHAN